MRDIELPPFAPLLMESTRAIGYSLETAIADILDNSISAEASKIVIKYSPYDEPYLAILDNGVGMDEEELTNAMRYGSYDSTKKREEKDLGRFGLGLKTASLSQCRRLTLVSKKNKVLSSCRWDLDYINKTGKWSLLILDNSEIIQLPMIEELNSSSNGTLVIWETIDKISIDSKSLSDVMIERMEDVGKHLSLVFHRYLKGENGIKKINITINGNKLIPIDPFLSEKSNQLFREEEIKIGKHKIVVTPFLLPHINNLTTSEIELLGGKDGLRKNQGFYIYRNKRLVIWGDWFRLTRKDDLSKLARVKVDIPNTLDSEWTLDVKKSTATPPYVIRKNLLAITEKICNSSKNTWNFRGKKETSNDVIHIWTRCVNREGIYYEVNQEHPLIQEIIETSDYSKTFFEVIKMLGRYLPMNQLYSDLTHDKKINKINMNDEEQSVDLFLNEILSTYDSDMANSYFDSLINVEPFCRYCSKIEKLKR